MKKCYLITVFIIVCSYSYAQQLSQVTFSGASVLSWFSILTSQNILIRISDDGKILEFGTEERSLYNRNYFAQQLIPFSGSVNYYDQFADSAYKRKAKNIGNCFFTYFPSYYNPQKAGKIKSAGNLSFDYYEQFMDAQAAGKIKNIGNMQSVITAHLMIIF